MSLLLTNALKPILEELKLPDCTLSIKSGILTVTGPCGQQLFTIPGFNQTTLRKAEIPLAIDLVEKFLTNNLDLITKFFELRKETKEMTVKINSEKVRLQAIGYNISSSTYGPLPTFNVYKNTEFGSINFNTKTMSINSISFNETAMTLKKALKLVPTYEEQMTKDFALFAVSTELLKQLNEVTTKLAACTAY